LIPGKGKIMRTALLITLVLAMTGFYGCKSHPCFKGTKSEKGMEACPPGMKGPECSRESQFHVQRIHGELMMLVHHLRADTKQVTDPQAKAMFETTAEAVKGLAKAYTDFEKGHEAAWEGGQNKGMMKEEEMENQPKSKGIADVNCGDDAKCHVKRIHGEMEKLIHHLRADVKVVSDPQAKAMFETSAEVLGGLAKAFKDYEEATEKAWEK
jgi:hypothetical protein